MGAGSDGDPAFSLSSVWVGAVDRGMTMHHIPRVSALIEFINVSLCTFVLLNEHDVLRSGLKDSVKVAPGSDVGREQGQGPVPALPLLGVSPARSQGAGRVRSPTGSVGRRTGRVSPGAGEARICGVCVSSESSFQYEPSFGEQSSGGSHLRLGCAPDECQCQHPCS